MREHPITLPHLGLISVTRAMIGFGAGLLLANRIGRMRSRVGWALVGVGALSTFPLAYRLFRKPTNHKVANVPQAGIDMGANVGV
jgi:hypothetical protein